MARIKVPQADGWIEIFDGETQTRYRVTEGEIEVTDNHVVGTLAGVPGSSLVPVPEVPAKSVKPESPAKEK